MTAKLLVTYGSQNGTAQDYAETLYLEASIKGYSVRLLTLDEYCSDLDGEPSSVVSLFEESS